MKVLALRFGARRATARTSRRRPHVVFQVVDRARCRRQKSVRRSDRWQCGGCTSPRANLCRPALVQKQRAPRQGGAVASPLGLVLLTSQHRLVVCARPRRPGTHGLDAARSCHDSPTCRVMLVPWVAAEGRARRGRFCAHKHEVCFHGGTGLSETGRRPPWPRRAMATLRAVA